MCASHFCFLEVAEISRFALELDVYLVDNVLVIYMTIPASKSNGHPFLTVGSVSFQFKENPTGIFSVDQSDQKCDSFGWASQQKFGLGFVLSESRAITSHDVAETGRQTMIRVTTETNQISQHSSEFAVDVTFGV
jgi:hypothetical protein